MSPEPRPPNVFPRISAPTVSVPPEFEITRIVGHVLLIFGDSLQGKLILKELVIAAN